MIMRELFIQRFDEEIREIADFPGYWASNLGRIISAPKSGNSQNKWIVLSLSPGKGGHLQVGLCREGKVHTKKVHVLVGRAFNDFSRPGRQWRHFPDSDKMNNRADNLKWGSSLEDSWDWIVDNGRQEFWGISRADKRLKKNPFKLEMGKKHIGSFPTREAARAERDRLCLLFGMTNRVQVIGRPFLRLQLALAA
jgi:hypothetical protein